MYSESYMKKKRKGEGLQRSGRGPGECREMKATTNKGEEKGKAQLEYSVICRRILRIDEINIHRK